MHALDITPRHIGQHIKVTDHNEGLQVEGTLTDLDVITRQIDETNLTRANIFGETITVYVTAIILNINGHELRLQGHENITTLDH